MSEEQKETTTLVNNNLTERINNAYIAKDYTLLNGGTDNILMVRGEKDDKSVDIFFVYSDIKSALEQLEPDTIQKKDDESGTELSENVEKSDGQ